MNKTHTLIHHLEGKKESHPLELALQFKDNGRWASYNWKELYSLVRSFASSLKNLGLKPKDRVLIMSKSRPEWLISDLAVMSCQAVTIPVYPNAPLSELLYILEDSKPRVIILENELQYDKWKQRKKQCPYVETVITLDSFSDKPPLTMHWSDLTNVSVNDKTINLSGLSSPQLATIIYTSGTTGVPKGVKITHEQIMSEVEDLFSIIPVNKSDSTLNCLPFSHILGRVESWGAVYCGYSIAFSKSMETFKKDLKTIKPTFIIGVPRLYEKLYVDLQAQLLATPVLSRLLHSALSVGKEISSLRQSDRDVSFALLTQFSLYRKLIIPLFKKSLGGQLRFAISGGAPLSEEIIKFFHSLDLLILEGYGLSETTAAVTLNTPLNYKFGTVGKPLKEVNIKIADDGEILIQSKKVMTGYLNNKDNSEDSPLTANGYFKTGDIGYLDEDGYLVVTDRKKDLIKTSGGKYVAPQKIEALLKKEPLISHVHIYGDREKYVVALFTLNPDELKKLKKNSGSVHSIIKNAVAEANSRLSSHETIKRYQILDNEFSVEGGELTPSLKIKRKYCNKKYKKEIESLYTSSRN